MAARSLSPKQAAERILRHRHAVIVLARQSAKKAIQAQIRAQGDKLTQVPARTISIFADAYFDVYRQRLMAEAEHAIATCPGFARWRVPDANITTNAQSESEPKSMTSAVQISGAQ
jgi:galactose-1-phosphate uridylyltransferase